MPGFLFEVCIFSPPDFLPHSKDVQVQLIGHSELPEDVHVSECGCGCRELITGLGFA